MIGLLAWLVGPWLVLPLWALLLPSASASSAPFETCRHLDALEPCPTGIEVPLPRLDAHGAAGENATKHGTGREDVGVPTSLEAFRFARGEFCGKACLAFHVI